MSAIKLSVVTFLLGSVCVSCQQPGPRVNTPLGNLIGYYKVSQSGKRYEAYDGIPYAEPPVGELRFEPPKPVQKWGYDLPANKKGSPCTQLAMGPAEGKDKVSGSEDCLYLNVYASIRNSSETLLPVMVWIHGGAFMFGSGGELYEGRLMDHDVIVVGFNYRLGPLGFLSTGDDVVPGNMGLKDQAVALRWVSENIKNFGGNPKDVTILGHSAGGTSVHFQYLSPLTAGLFQRGISFSGLSLNPRSIVRGAPEKAKRIAAILGCPTENSTIMVSCLKERPPRAITQSVSDIQYWLSIPSTPFGPVVEKGGSTPFIDRTPYEIISSGAVYDVPWITGTLSEEGLFPAAEFVGSAKLLKELNDNWDNIAPYLLTFDESIPIDKHKQVAEKIRKHYLGSKEIDRDSALSLIHMLGDRAYLVGCEKAIRLQAKVNKSPVWAYYYTYKSDYSTKEHMSLFKRNYGVGHGEDVNLVLNPETANVTNPEDIKMQHLLIELYTSFAIHGKPHVAAVWEPENPNDKDFHYLHIESPEKLGMKFSNNFGDKSFWNTINAQEIPLS